jgi:hypothetical protein
MVWCLISTRGNFSSCSGISIRDWWQSQTDLELIWYLSSALITACLSDVNAPVLMSIYILDAHVNDIYFTWNTVVYCPRPKPSLFLVLYLYSHAPMPLSWTHQYTRSVPHFHRAETCFCIHFYQEIWQWMFWKMHILVSFYGSPSVRCVPFSCPKTCLTISCRSGLPLLIKIDSVDSCLSFSICLHVV